MQSVAAAAGCLAAQPQAGGEVELRSELCVELTLRHGQAMLPANVMFIATELVMEAQRVAAQRQHVSVCALTEGLV